jgi:pSer/pThr/pTyr-binding forkhead associated (FHA) protein
MASITIRSGPEAGFKLDIKQDEVLIGRSSDCDVSVSDKSVSGRHCAILNNGGRYLLRDLESTNGTRLNGGLVKQARLKPGDTIEVGSVELVLEGSDVIVDDVEPESAPRSATPPTVIVPSSVNEPDDAESEQAAPAFEARQTSRLRWILLGAVIATTLIGLGYWFLTVLFQR